MTKSLDEFMSEIGLEREWDRDTAKVIIKEAIRVCEEYCNEEIRRKEYSPGGHPMNVVDMWGHIHNADDLLRRFKSWAGEHEG